MAQDLHDGRRRRAHKVQIIARRRQLKRRIDSLRGHIGESGLAEIVLQQSRLAQAQQPARRKRIAWPQARMPARGGHQDADARVALRLRKDQHGGMPARPQYPVHLPQRAQRVGAEHQAEPAHGRVKTGFVERQVLGVADPRLHLRQPGLMRILAGELQNSRGNVGGQHPAAVSHPVGNVQRLVARAGGNVEHAHARADPRRIEQRRRRGGKPVVDRRRLVVPAAGRLVPRLADGILELFGTGWRHADLLRVDCGPASLLPKRSPCKQPNPRVYAGGAPIIIIVSAACPPTQKDPMPLKTHPLQHAC